MYEESRYIKHYCLGKQVKIYSVGKAGKDDINVWGKQVYTTLLSGESR